MGAYIHRDAYTCTYSILRGRIKGEKCALFSILVFCFVFVFLLLCFVCVFFCDLFTLAVSY